MYSVTSQWRQEISMALLDNEDFNNFAIGKASDPTPDGEVEVKLIVANLNSFHGEVHDLTGGDISDLINSPKQTPRKETPTNGNMAHVPLAGFDPIFFFWHAWVSNINLSCYRLICWVFLYQLYRGVDRYIAMWQAGHPGDNPKYWLSKEEDKLPLYPFVDPSGSNWWRSENCRDVNSLGYTYEILDDIAGQGLELTTLKLYSDIKGDVSLSSRYERGLARSTCAIFL